MLKTAKGLFFPLLELKPVSDHGNELRVGGLALGVGDGIAEVLLSIGAQRLQGILWT
ncbi:hypothetical protein BACCAP_01085 [Pseudoflavonifractor capillosus ATCC 29799]|uniref:Uncharacterized protein n=1 Tax=Pseudoflavonifractor capillosus ATCC 29799 TaxID=411467 RepID=A6NSA6_9FIRM|nr:hypothetical protein BACCAP_01085 [Pseudoflavonifractor capillosus ATCC 29799]